MNLDQNSLQRLLSLNDAQLRRVLKGLAADYGVDLSAFPLGDADLARLRSVLAAASPQDVEQFLNQFSNLQGRPRPKE